MNQTKSMETLGFDFTGFYQQIRGEIKNARTWRFWPYVASQIHFRSGMSRYLHPKKDVSKHSPSLFVFWPVTLARFIGGFELPDNYIGIIGEMCVVAYACLCVDDGIFLNSYNKLGLMIRFRKSRIAWGESLQDIPIFDGKKTKTMISDFSMFPSINPFPKKCFQDFPRPSKSRLCDPLWPGLSFGSAALGPLLGGVSC